MTDSHETPALHHFPERGNGGIAVFGITGRTGHAVARAALERDIPVRALIRPGSGPVPGGADLLVGSLLDHEAVGRVIDGVDAVCCTIGPRPPYHDVFTAATTSVIVSCMREANVDRLVCVTGAMIGNHPANRTFPFRLMRRLARWRLPASFSDRNRQEEVVIESGLDWTVVKPPRLTDGPGGVGYRAGPDIRIGVASSIARADLAHFILETVTTGSGTAEAVFIKS